MTDNEIVKALECCSHPNMCRECPCSGLGKCWDVKQDAIKLINRQQAEIERLCMEIDELIIAKDLLFDEAEALIKKAKAEAIKEFVSMVKEHSYQNRYGDYIVDVDDIDNVMKEKVGE